jgi:hypothetical protein
MSMVRSVSASHTIAAARARITTRPKKSEMKKRRSIFSPTLLMCQLTRRRNGESNSALNPNIRREVSS